MPVTINGDGAITGLVITTADLADSSVTTAKIAAGAVATVDIADSAVTTAKIADANVTGAKLENSGATAGTYTYSTVTVDAKGRVTSASSGSSPAPPTTLYAVGTYIMGRPANTTNYAVNSTIAGSSLYATSVGGQFLGPPYCPPNVFDSYSGATLVNTGTWRCMSTAFGNSGINGQSGLWVRIS